MTIMAWDGKTLAVDSRVTMGGTVVTDNFNKMYEINHPKLGNMVCAVTGACDFIGPWLETISRDGFKPVEIPGMDEDYSMSGLFVDSEGDCWNVSSNGGYYHMGKTPCALGSATTLATYLLKDGKSALKTVQECCKANLFCGGEVKVYTVKNSKITTH